MGDAVTRPITRLSEEEEIFRETVREFAEERIRPRVAEMDRDAVQPPELLEALFEMGLMGIEIPEEYGGAGASFFMSILAIEELSRIEGVVDGFANAAITSAAALSARPGLLAQ